MHRICKACTGYHTKDEGENLKKNEFSTTFFFIEILLLKMRLEEAEKEMETEKAEKKALIDKVNSLTEENKLLKSRLQDEVKKRIGIHTTK